MAKILMVEDDIPTAELVQMILKPRGIDLVHIADGSLAIETAKQHLPDLILLDVMLPGMDGYSIQSGLCEEDHLRKIPVIMLTSKAQMEEFFRTAPNVVDFIEKPFSIRDFLEKVNRQLNH